MNILLTGATGYIGRRLKRKLLDEKDVRLRLLVRDARKISPSVRGRVEIIEGDTFSKETLLKAVQGIEIAYYLVHSYWTAGNFDELNKVSAENFRDACIEAGVKRIIYLGSLGIREESHKYIASRLRIGEILSARPDRIQTIWFRTNMIVGSGSATFEGVWNIVEKLPVIPLPRWGLIKKMPVAINDLLTYLVRSKDLQTKDNLIVDIGSGLVSLKEIIEIFSKTLGLKRRIFLLPVAFPRLSSYLVALITPVTAGMASIIVEGFQGGTAVPNDNARKHFPDITPMSLEEAIQRAVAATEKNQVVSRWSDSDLRPPSRERAPVDPSQKLFRDIRRLRFGELSAHAVFRSVKLLGGRQGWFTYNILWKIRGTMDKLAGGFGTTRGRRDVSDLRIGDTIDVWKVTDIVEDKRLLLEAEMKLPGKAWLEFRIEGNSLVQTAYFFPRGLWGRLYWYLFLPSHLLIFPDMARNIIKRAREQSEDSEA